MAKDNEWRGLTQVEARTFADRYVRLDALALLRGVGDPDAEVHALDCAAGAFGCWERGREAILQAMLDEALAHAESLARKNPGWEAGVRS